MRGCPLLVIPAHVCLAITRPLLATPFDVIYLGDLACVQHKLQTTSYLCPNPGK